MASSASFFVFALACCLLSTLPPATGQAAGGVFAKLHGDVISWYYKHHPFSATMAGKYMYNDLLGSLDIALQPQYKGEADAFLGRLRAIDRGQLTTRDERTSYDVLLDMLQTLVDGYQWRHFQGLNPISLMEGWQAWPGYFSSVMPFNTIGDFENYLARLQRFPTLIDEYIALMQEAVRQNRTYHNVSIELVYAQIDVIINKDVYNSSFYAPLRDRLENKTTIPITDKERLRNRSRSAVGDILNAFRRLKTYLQNDYAPNTRSFYGMLGFPQGQEYYAACLRWYLSTNYTPEQVHNIGLREVARIEGNMKRIMAKQGFEGSVSEYFKMLMNDSRFFRDTGEELLQEYRDIIFDRIEPKLSHFFNNLPGLPIEVKATTTDGIGGSYSQGSADGSRPGVFNANVMRPKNTPTFTMMALTLHEANPGHHLQISYSLVADVPEFRRNMGSNYGSIVPFVIPSYPSYVEGWGLYSEALGEEMNLYKNDYELMGRYSYEIFRACRLVVDTGIHYYGWDKQKAIEYMLNYTAETEASVETEVNRYITIPGQACAYKIGEIKIWELRRKAEAALGSRFDLKAFHSVVVETGNLPLLVLENAVNSWINDVNAGTPTTGPACGSTSLHSDVMMAFTTVLNALTLVIAFVLL